MNDAVDWHSRIAAEFEQSYSSSPAFRERMALWMSLLEQYALLEHSILDAGCGPGLMTQVAARLGRRVTAFDGSAKMLDIAQRRCQRAGFDNVDFLEGRFEDAQLLADQQYDVVICSSVLEYIEDWHSAFGRLAAWTAPDGIMLVSLPNPASIYRKMERIAYKITGWPAYYAFVNSMPCQQEVMDVASSCGMEIVNRHFFAAAPILSGIARKAGHAERADNLVLYVVKHGKH